MTPRYLGGGFHGGEPVAGLDGSESFPGAVTAARRAARLSWGF
jgi:hypothetical protein